MRTSSKTYEISSAEIARYLWALEHGETYLIQCHKLKNKLTLAAWLRRKLRRLKRGNH